MCDIIHFDSLGVRLEGRFFAAGREPDPCAVVLILTGDSQNGTKSSTWPPMIAALRARGLSVFAFDFCGQGHSEGERSALSIGVGCQNFADAHAALGRHVDLPHHRVGLFGSSFGGAVLLASHTNIAPFHAMALKSPASFLAESYETEHGFPDGMDAWRSCGISSVTGLHYQSYLEALRYNIYPAAMEIGVPVLVVHGSADTIVPINQSRRLCHLLGERSKLVELPGVNHDYKQAGALDTLQKVVCDFFAATLLH